MESEGVRQLQREGIGIDMVHIVAGDKLERAQETEGERKRGP